MENKEYRFENDRITDGLDIFFWIFNDSSSFVATHWHTAIEIMHILDGQVDITMNNKTTILKPGDTYLVDSTVLHSTKSVHGNRAILIQLPYALLKRYIPEFDNLTFSFDCHSCDEKTKTKILKLNEVIHQMQVVFEVSPKGHNLRFNSLVFELMYQMYHNFSHEISDLSFSKESKNFKSIETVLNYSNKYYNRHISLEEISSVACFQKDYFCHFFKKHMGMTYSQYLNELRLSHVYDDLISTDLPLKVILEKHGFTNYKLFRQIFNEHFHTTPMEYRKQVTMANNHTHIKSKLEL